MHLKSAASEEISRAEIVTWRGIMKKYDLFGVFFWTLRIDSSRLQLHYRIILAGGPKAVEVNVSVLGGRLYLEEYDPAPQKYVVHGLISYNVLVQVTYR